MSEHVGTLVRTLPIIAALVCLPLFKQQPHLDQLCQVPLKLPLTDDINPFQIHFRQLSGALIHGLL